MGIRETLNQNPAITTGATAVIVLLAVGLIVYQIIGDGGGGVAGSGKYFFSIDDGTNWFRDDASKVPPFQKDGKPAYQVFVWTCDDGKTNFVSHLQRFTPEAKRKIEEARAKGPGSDLGAIEMTMMTGVEVKAPGTGDDPKNWVKQSDPAAANITRPKCPHGQASHTPEPVMP